MFAVTIVFTTSKFDLQSFNWCPLGKQLKHTFLSDTKLFISAGVFARKYLQFIKLWLFLHNQQDNVLVLSILLSFEISLSLDPWLV